MKTKGKFQRQWIFMGCFFMFLFFLIGLSQAGEKVTKVQKPAAPAKKVEKPAVPSKGFVPLKGDLAKYDPNNPAFFVTSGDTIKLAIWDVFSGPNAWIAESYYNLAGFVAHDINSQGGIKVDGKMKKVQIIKMDTQGQPDVAKRALEKAILQDKIQAFTGVAGSNLAKIGQAMAKEYKVIFVNMSAYADELNMVPDFNEYYFRTCGSSTTTAKALAIFYKNRPETKFYILAQDYVWGHESTTVFKETMKKSKPNAKIVGEEFFPLMTKDFAPYLEKVRASGAEVIITMAWGNDSELLIKQSVQLGIKSPLNPDRFIPMASPFLDATQPLEAIGGPAGRGHVLCADFQLDRKLRPLEKKFDELWGKLWKTWKEPYNAALSQHPNGGWYRNLTGYYWYLQAVQKAGSLDPQKIIAAWEGDTFDGFGWKHYMRPDDHQVIADRPIMEMVFPNDWEQPKNAGPGPARWIPAKDCMPAFDEKLRGRSKVAEKPFESATPVKKAIKPAAPAKKVEKSAAPAKK